MYQIRYYNDHFTINTSQSLSSSNISSLFESFSSSRKQFPSKSDRKDQINTSAIEREHQDKMQKMHLDHEKVMSSIETQSKLEAQRNREMMKGLHQHMKILDDTRCLDVPQFSGSNVIIFN